MRAIIDEFTNLPISRQLKYIRRKERDKLCRECGNKLYLPLDSHMCLNCLINYRERQRKITKAKRRNNSKSYLYEL